VQDARPTGPGSDAQRGRVPRLPLSPALRWCLRWYVGTRLVAMAAVALYLAFNPKVEAGSLVTKWDGWWYERIATLGYSRSLRPPLPRVTDWHHNYSDWAFFPGYPVLIRALHEVTFLPIAVVALGLSVVLGLVATRAVYALGEEYGGEQVGRAASLLFLAWPGSAVLGEPYSEGLYLAAAGYSLLFLIRRRWVLAGLLGAVATATRPTGTALIAAAGVVALVELWRRRDWWAVAAPALSATGIAGFVAFGWWRTGDPQVWRHAENLWVQRFDLNHKQLRTLYRSFVHLPSYLRSAGNREILAASVAQAFGILGMTGLLGALWALRRRLNLALAVYAFVALLTVVGYSAVGPRPRTLLAVLPAFVWTGAWLPPRVTQVTP